MKFGKTEHPENVDFSLPPTHKQTEEVLKNSKGADFNVRIGCAKWNRKDLKNFYPRGTKDELSYYSTQFNSIEFNACFYRIFPEEQFRTWYEKAEDDFQFFPKISRPISHLKRLNDAEELVDKYISKCTCLEGKIRNGIPADAGEFSSEVYRKVGSFLSLLAERNPSGGRISP